MATTAEGMYAIEAKENMSEGGKEGGRGRKKEKGEANLPHPKARAEQSREKAAKATGASGRYIQDAKALKKADPELAWGYPPGSVGISVLHHQNNH